MSTDDLKKLLTEKLSDSIMEHREELIRALKAIDSTGDATDEQFITAIAAITAAIIAA
ncbi:hypothetical protein MTO96_051659, partial [Rhipicephalus appendiculatus]